MSAAVVAMPRFRPLVSDRITSQDEAILEIYKRLRPGDPPTIEPAKVLFDNLFFNPDRYDLSTVGRLKLNERLGLDAALEQRTLTKEDILKTVGYLLNHQQWAITVALAARLPLAVVDTLCTRGAITPPECYIPSGLYG